MRKWLKAEIWLSVSGVLLALALAFGILSFFVTASAFITMRTALEAEASWWLDSLVPVDEDLTGIGFFILCILLVTFCAAFLRSISDKFTFGRLRSLKGIMLWLFAVCTLIVSYIVPIITSFETIGGDLPTLDYYLNTIKLKYLVPVLGLSFIWLVAGAGCQSGSRKQRLFNALRGAMVGASVILLNYLGSVAGDISGETYYVYHGKPYEDNPYMYQYYGSIFFLNYMIVLLGSAGLALALSFREFSRRTRIKWAGFALALCVGLFLFSGITYFNSKTELDELKKPIALSAGLSLEEPPIRYVVPLKNETARIVEWPVTFKIYNYFEREAVKRKSYVVIRMRSGTEFTINPIKANAEDKFVHEAFYIKPNEFTRQIWSY